MSELVEKVKRGQVKFNKLYALSDAELKKLLASRYGEGNLKHLFEGTNARITRTIVDEEPYEIKIEFYDALEINWMGINYKPEHGPKTSMLDFEPKSDTNDDLLKFIYED